MSANRIPVDINYLRQLVPMTDLTQDNLRELAKSAFVEELPAGKALFKRGDVDEVSFYLITGEVELDFANGERKNIVGGTSQCRFPIDHHRPRQATCIAKTPIQFTRIDNNHLDVLLTWDQNAGYMVNEIDVEEEETGGEDDGDWMTHMLRSNIFHRIPPSNIQTMFMKMEPVPVRQGDVVIKQGAEGDYYYYIKQGRAVVTRTTRDGKTIKLAELEAGSSFGEEALISNNKRNANVSMLSDGVLMRLGKADFESLLKAAILESVAYEEAERMVKEEGAVWLDVRLESEHKNHAIPGSLNIPLYLLRIKARGLDKGKKYIVYCDTGRRSSSAAYLLSERGFETYVLKGGLMASNTAA